MNSCCECNDIISEDDAIEVPTDKEAQKQWAAQYDLELRFKDDSCSNFVCKKHIPDEPMDYKEDSLLNINSELIREVKQEIEDVEDEHKMEEDIEMWEEPKDEPTTDDNEYGQFPIGMEQNEYTSYEQAPTYELKYEDEQPTTSSSHQEDSMVLPEISDTQLMSLCIKNGGYQNGGSSFECCFCNELVFGTFNSQTMRLHFQNFHENIVRAVFIDGVYNPQIPKPVDPIQPTEIERADRALCKFFLSNGLPLSAVEDRNLNMLAFNYNSSYEMPTVERLFEEAVAIGEEKERSMLRSENPNGSATVTFDTTSFNNVNYIAFSINFQQESSLMRRSVFLRELEVVEPVVPGIISIVKQTAEEYGLVLPLTSIVTGKAEYEEALEKNGCFQQVMVCFSHSVNKFAEALVNAPVFARPLNILREFIRKFPLDKQLFNKFKQYIIKRRTYGEYPEIDDENWLTTIDFITKCLHMHRLFSEFVANANKSGLIYIGVDDNVNIVYLHSLLNQCKATLKNLVTTRASISEVIPAITDINGSIGITTSRPQVVQDVNSIFRKLLLPFVEQSDLHRFAMYLNPCHYGSEILQGEDWENIKYALIRTLNSRENAERNSTNRLGNTRGLLTTLRDTVTAENEVLDYTSWVHSVRLDAVTIIDLWARHSKRFPRLSKYAMELFQIPAFAIDADHYLGNFGILSYSLQDLDPPKRKIMLKASSEVVKFHCKGELMTKVICVKKKRDASCPEDSWYTPIDMRMSHPAYPPPNEPCTPMRQTLASAARTNLLRSAAAAAKKVEKQAPVAEFKRKSEIPRSSLKQEMQKLEAMKTRALPHKKYTLGPAVPKVSYQNGLLADLPVKTEEMPILVKTEQEQLPGPSSSTSQPPRKIYSIRPAAPNGNRPLIPAVNRNNRFLAPVPPVHPIVVRHGTNPPQTKRVYIVRAKTGPSSVPQPPKVIPDQK